MREQKLLVIGSTGHQFVKCIEWGFDILPNLVDYDFIIINVRSLDDKYLKKISSKQAENFRRLLTRFLWSDGSLIILSDLNRTVKRPKKYPGTLSNYFWSPIIIRTHKESGTTIEIVKNKFPKYFSNFKYWDYYFFMPNNCLSRELTDIIGSSSEIKYVFPDEPLIKNRYGKMLSGIFTCEIYHIDFEGCTKNKPNKVFGEIVLLPLINELDHKNAISVFLEDLLNKPQTLLPPDWVSKVKIPFIKEIQPEINKKFNEIDIIQKKISILENKINEIESYKKLIYSDGKELEDIFRKCLISLGGKVVPAKYSNEEYCLIYKNADYPVEAKGVSRSITLTHLRQIIDYMLKYEEETGKKCKGILLGNPWKKRPIKERNSKGNPDFPPNVIERAKELNVILISSVDFFHAFCKFLDDNSLSKKILNLIADSTGLVKFKL